MSRNDSAEESALNKANAAEKASPADGEENPQPDGAVDTPAEETTAEEASAEETTADDTTTKDTTETNAPSSSDEAADAQGEDTSEDDSAVHKATVHAADAEQQDKSAADDIVRTQDEAAKNSESEQEDGASTQVEVAKDSESEQEDGSLTQDEPAKDTEAEQEDGNSAQHEAAADSESEQEGSAPTQDEPAKDSEAEQEDSDSAQDEVESDSEAEMETTPDQDCVESEVSDETSDADDVDAHETDADDIDNEAIEEDAGGHQDEPTQELAEPGETIESKAEVAENNSTDTIAGAASVDIDATATDAEAAIAAGAAQAIQPLTEATDFATAKKRYTLWGVGLTCMASEGTWFFGSKALLAMLKYFGLQGAHINFAVAVAWFPVTMFLLPLGYMKLRGIDSERFIGLRGDFKPINVALVVLAAFSVWALMRVPEALWAEFMHYIFGDNMPHISGISAYNTIFIIDFVRKCIIPAFFEEYLYRGFMFRGLRGGLGPVRAAVISSVIFMLMHTDLTNVVAPLALGLLCSYLLEVTGSIFPCMISHFVYNLSSTLGNLNLSARGFSSQVLGGNFEITLAALMAASCMLLLAISLFFIRRDGRYKKSVAINEYAECSRKPLDLLPFFSIAAMLVLGYVL